MFDTYGPYTLPSQNRDGLRQMINEIQSGPFPNLENGVGIYIWLSEEQDGRLVPQYVGQTYAGFARRFLRHIEHERFSALGEKPLKVFLLARARRGQALSPKEKGRDRRDRKYLDYLEVDLIDCCRKINPKLLNVREVAFLRGLHVPGYRDENSDEREEAANKLAEVLGSCGKETKWQC